MKIGIVAGESSGDLIGSSAISQIKTLYPDANFIGIGGPKMEEVGCQLHFHIDDLNTLGLTEVIKKLPKIRKIKNKIYQTFLSEKIDFFVGVDYSEFNLSLGNSLHQAGIKTVQIKPPSVWAWREYRLKKIKASFDLLVTLFPFEKKYFERKGVPTVMFAHPMIHEIALASTKVEARQKLGLAPNDLVIAMQPGSRGNELNRVGKLLLASLPIILKQRPNVQIISGLMTKEHELIIIDLAKQLASNVTIKTFVGQTRDVIAAADLALVKSGTSTFETMLLKTPQVVTYKLSWLTEWIIDKLMKVKYISLPNLIAEKEILPELIGSQATSEMVAQKALSLINNPENLAAQVKHFHEIHEMMIAYSHNDFLSGIRKLIHDE